MSIFYGLYPFSPRPVKLLALERKPITTLPSSASTSSLQVSTCIYACVLKIVGTLSDENLKPTFTDISVKRLSHLADIPLALTSGSLGDYVILKGNWVLWFSWKLIRLALLPYFCSLLFVKSFSILSLPSSSFILLKG